MESRQVATQAQAGVRSFIITFDVYVILNVLRNMIIKDLTPYVYMHMCIFVCKKRVYQVMKDSQSTGRARCAAGIRDTDRYGAR